MLRSLMFSLCLALGIMPAEARGLDARITFAPATAAGIRQAPAYDPGPLSHYSEAPTADVLYLRRPAPPNGCEGAEGGFLVTSGPIGRRGCYGWR